MAIDWTKPIRMISDYSVPVRHVCELDSSIGVRRLIVYGHPGDEHYTVVMENGAIIPGERPAFENIPEPPKYRPYTNEEMASLVGKILIHGSLSMRSMVTSYATGDVWIVDDWKNADQLWANWNHEDGTPCGVLEGGDA